MVQLGKISHGVYPEYAEGFEMTAPPTLFVISSECEKSFPTDVTSSESNCTTTGSCGSASVNPRNRAGCVRSVGRSRQSQIPYLLGRDTP